MRLIFLALVASLVWGQFTQIATTGDARQIYFTTRLSDRNAPESRIEHRIYRINEGRLELFADRGDLVRTDAFGSNDGAGSLSVSTDGQSVAFSLWNICPPGQAPCRGTFARSEVRGRHAQTFDQTDRILLSRNGRWALLTPLRTFTFGQPPPQTEDSTLIDLETGARATITRPLTGPEEYFALASNGSLLTRVPRDDGRPEYVIWRNGQPHPLPPLTGAAVAFLGLSDDASTVIAQRIEFVPNQPARPHLVAVDLATGTSRTLTSTEFVGRWTLLGFSSDGSRALLSSLGSNGPGPGYLADFRRGTLDPINLPGNERPVAGALTDDGNIVIIGTNAGRILRITGNTQEELLPATPYVPEFGRSISPGLRFQITPPLPGDIDWRGRIRINGLPLAILGRTPFNQLDVQVPWELQPANSASTLIDYPSTSPLEQRDRIFIVPQSPGIPQMPAGARGLLGGLLIKGDFSGYVTEPLKPGDIVHMYLTGLGPVQGPVETGVPAREANPLLVQPQCGFQPGQELNAETLYAGLAPGMIGIYQLTLRLPPNTAPVPTGINCRFGTGFWGLSINSMP